MADLISIPLSPSCNPVDVVEQCVRIVQRPDQVHILLIFNLRHEESAFASCELQKRGFRVLGFNDDPVQHAMHVLCVLLQGKTTLINAMINENLPAREELQHCLPSGHPDPGIPKVRTA